MAAAPAEMGKVFCNRYAALLFIARTMDEIWLIDEP